MLRIVAGAGFSLLSLISTQADARENGGAPFWSSLDHNGTLSAGWVQVLPVLASACKMKLDSRELNSKLVELSEVGGNADYTRDLYWHLHLMDRHKAKNTFVGQWTARFGSNQKEACDTAERLWGNAGQQFPGVLLREASLDTDPTSTIAPNGPSTNCR